MAKFDLKKAILENKATFFGSLNEGQFSWMTQDTGQQIGSQDENKIPVYMFDDKGKYYYENDYDGYGVFGGKDYYELLDQMNGGTGDRERGIDLAFDKEAIDAGKILFPALITNPDRFNYKTHNFTQEAETDPNQSWYEPEEDDDYIMGNDDDDDINRYGDEDEEELDEIKEIKPTTKMKKSDLKAKIKEMIVAEIALDIDNMEDAPESEVDFLAELEGILDEAEGDEEATDDVTADDVTIDDTETIDTETTTEVNPDVKAVQDALTQAQAAAQKLGDAKLTDQIGNTITFFTRAHVVEKGAVAENIIENIGKTLEIKNPDDLKKVEGSQIFKYDVFDREDFEQYKVYVLADDKSQAEKIAKEKFPKQFPPYKLDTGYPQKSSAAENLWTGKEKNSFWYGVEKTGAVAENINESMFPMLNKILK